MKKIILTLSSLYLNTKTFQSQRISSENNIFKKIDPNLIEQALPYTLQATFKQEQKDISEQISVFYFELLKNKSSYIQFQILIQDFIITKHLAITNQDSYMLHVSEQIKNHFKKIFPQTDISKLSIHHIKKNLQDQLINKLKTPNIKNIEKVKTLKLVDLIKLLNKNSKNNNASINNLNQSFNQLNPKIIKKLAKNLFKINLKQRYFYKKYQTILNMQTIERMKLFQEITPSSHQEQQKLIEQMRQEKYHNITSNIFFCDIDSEELFQTICIIDESKNLQKIKKNTNLILSEEDQLIHKCNKKIRS